MDLLNPTLASMVGPWWSRSWSVALLIWVVLYPLCSLKDLAALAPFSIAGVCSVAYVVGFMCVRALDGSYAPGGAYYREVGEGGGHAQVISSHSLARSHLSA